MQKILPVIMCGGAGNGSWPESRETLPKQFIPLIGARSTFQDTAALLAPQRICSKQPIVITNYDYRFLVAEQLAADRPRRRHRARAARRDSGPAVAVAAELAAARSPSTIVAVMAADHTSRIPPR